ncbi:amino acid adenylation domain-containing protein [Paenibacillus sp. 5J-6]|uniref:Amino acid adenylation domain-containing protein n=1 Tax=Paenibacillus silvestris TaxID=2606219 RepID=A0A6L8URL8_9BACL|nr:non-ribosomal peptide synthetase [Paenibacillus silvestris]MZQ80577.1 amino acid adenylation domain-containing protein [Paenibacillus silvestris]
MTKFVSLVDVIQRKATMEEKGITYIHSETEEQYVSYRNIYNNALRLLSHLQDRGVKPGSEIIFQLDHNNYFIEAFWACMLGGFIPVPLSVGTNSEQKKKLFTIWPLLSNPYLLTEARVYRLLHKFADSNQLEERMAEIERKVLHIEYMQDGDLQGRIHEAAADEIAMIQFSSGSTGTPKGVVLTHENLLVNIEGIISSDRNRWAEDKFLSWMPLTHDLGLIGFHLAPIILHADQCLMSTALFIRDPIIWLKKSMQHQATVLSSPNFGLIYVLDFFKPEFAANLELGHIKKILNGAEPISPDVCARFMNTLGAYNLKSSVMLPAYGLAEASVGVTLPVSDTQLHVLHLNRSSLSIGETVQFMNEREGGSVSFIDLGPPIKGTDVGVFDHSGSRLEEYHLGHVHIRGKNVTKGYYNNPEQTQKALRADGWLDTGDLGFLHKGRLVVTGRAKDIIFVNGQNLYPHDIERIAEEVDHVGLGRAAATGVYNQVRNKEEIVLFIRYRGELEAFARIANKVRAHVSLQLGVEIPYVIPILYLPKTTSGKIQRYLLNEQFQAGEYQHIVDQFDELLKVQHREKTLLEPKNDIEEALHSLWVDVLELDQISMDDHFFELGGQSLKASMLVSRINKQFHVDIPLYEIFETPTIREMAATIQMAETSVHKPIQAAAAEAYYPLTSAQKRMYILHQFEDIGFTYHVSFAALVEGHLDVQAFEAAWEALVENESIFRTSFHTLEQDVVQKVHSDVSLQIEYGFADDRDPQVIMREFIRPFDLSLARLWRIGLFKLSQNKHMWMIDTHHIVTDRTSLLTVLHQFASQYNSGNSAIPSLQYKDYAVWQKQSLESGLMDKQREFWLETLSGELPVLELSSDYPRSSVQSFEGDQLIFELGAELTGQLRELAVSTGTTIYMILFAAYQVLLHKYTGQKDIIIGVPASGRRHADLQDMLGMFVHTLPIRCYPEGERTFRDFLQEVKHQLLTALDHQDYPLELLLKDLHIQRDTGRNPLFDMVFVMQNMTEPDYKLDQLTVTPIQIVSETAKFDITLEALEEDDHIYFSMEYATRLYDRATIERMAGHYVQLIQSVMHEPDQLLNQIVVLQDRERQLLIEEFNDTTAEYPQNKTIHQLFEEQAERSPEAVALLFEDTEITYAELNRRADKLAYRLRLEGMGKGDFVGVLMERSPHMVVATLGILKAGAAYVPLDSALPQARLVRVLSAVQMRGLVTVTTQSDLAWQLVQASALETVITLDAQQDEGIEPERSVVDEWTVQPDDVAYTIFTSGSTGTPKGVVVTHRPVINLIHWLNESYAISPADRILFITSLSFDLSVYDMFGMLAAGGSIRIVGDKDVRDPQRLLQMMHEEPITIWDSAPAALAQLEPFFAQRGSIPGESNLRLVLLSGDWIPLTLPVRLQRTFPGVQVIGMGGATEATIWSNYYEIGEIDPAWTSIPYGRPIHNARYYILDAQLEPAPIGVPGDLYIGGECLAEGYIGDEELTVRKFTVDPFSSRSGARMYHTGDRARWKSDGQMEFLGRIDHQVKIRGYRIELGEIQAALLKHPEIQAAVAVVRESEAGEKTICAYVIAERELAVAELREFLASELPGYMIPSYFMRLESLPVTANGKLDAKALPAPPSEVNTGAAYEEPRNETEAKLAQIWQDVLRMERVSIHDPFFHLGGDSIKAIQVIYRLSNEGMKLEIRDFFQYPTIAQLSLHVKAEAVAAEQGTIEGEVALTAIQMWFFEQYGREAHFNQALMLHSHERLEEAALRRTFERLIQHHDALRLVFSVSGQIHRGADEPSMELHRFDFRGMSPANERIEAEASQLQSGMNLAEGPLVRLGLFHTDQGDHLLIVIHHLLIDGVSWRILLEDFASVYRQALSGEELRLGAKTHPYRDWSIGLHRYAQSAELLKEKAYWRQLESRPVEALPKDVQLVEQSGRPSETVRINWSAEMTEKLVKETGKAYNTDMDVTLLTALALAIEAWTGSKEVLVQLEGHGREAIMPELNVSRTVGWFTSMYPVRLEMHGSDNLGYQIKSVKESLRQVPNKGTGYGLLKYLTPPELKEDLNFTLQPQISFNYLGQFELDEEAENNGWEVSELSAGSTVNPDAPMPFAININAVIQEGKLVVLADYDQKQFRAASMEQLFQSFQHYVNQIMEHCLQQTGTAVTPSDLIYKEFDLEEFDQFVNELALDLSS